MFNSKDTKNIYLNLINNVKTEKPKDRLIYTCMSREKKNDNKVFFTVQKMIIRFNQQEENLFF
jgi:hypothetical protein